MPHHSQNWEHRNWERGDCLQEAGDLGSPVQEPRAGQLSWFFGGALYFEGVS
jgi:hypothetical protein